MGDLREVIRHQWHEQPGPGDPLAQMTVPVSRNFVDAMREVWRRRGPAHRWVDRWRFDLGWNVPSDVVANYLARDKA